MFDKICLILFYIFHVICYIVIIMLFPCITFFLIHSVLKCSILCALIYDIAFYVFLYLIFLFILMIYHGYEIYEEKAFDKRYRHDDDNI